MYGGSAPRSKVNILIIVVGVVTLVLSLCLLIMLVVEVNFKEEGKARLAVLLTSDIDLDDLAAINKYESTTRSNNWTDKVSINTSNAFNERYYIGGCLLFLVFQSVASWIMMWTTAKRRWLTAPWFLCKTFRLITPPFLGYYYYVKHRDLPDSTIISAIVNFEYT
ncbi:uncharacterized protein [Periplaneta americana]|uniref:uncharacterized protein isoform X2 n=1 Tax=Periplaneta americana TaxID=6978 RepID=UPI0037E73E72